MDDFDSWRAFWKFEREVSRSMRYIRTPYGAKFLDSVKRGCLSRVSNISKGRTLWRAQVGSRTRTIEPDGIEVPAAFLPERMKPLSDKAYEGRANPKGIPVLYLGSNRDAAISEVRPWLETYVSVGRFVTKRDMRVVDCSRGTEAKGFLFLDEPDSGKRSEAVWSAIDQAFTKPVTRSDDTGEYVATQILAELFRSEGFDGVAYRSAFGERSTNYAFFDLECADMVTGHLFQVTSAKINAQERDNMYWVRRKK